jgi:hypothetical protein
MFTTENFKNQKASSRRRGYMAWTIPEQSRDQHARSSASEALLDFVLLRVVLLDFEGLDHHELAHLSLVQELDAPRNLGEEGVVFAAADIQPGFYTRATLANDDGAAGHNLPAECLESKPLRV